MLSPFIFYCFHTHRKMANASTGCSNNNIDNVLKQYDANTGIRIASVTQAQKKKKIGFCGISGKYFHLFL